jgi:hypothetical protein
LLGIVALLSAGMAACSGSGNPTSPTASGPAPAPAPSVETRWDLDITVRYVKASGDEACDGKNIFGRADPGEFQYRIVASFGSRSETLESFNYGSVAGISYILSPEEIRNFSNETWTFDNLSAGQGVRLTLYATEWDRTNKDGDMNNRSESLTITPSSLLPTGGTRTDRALGVGNARCGLTLYHDVTARQRQVTTG